MNKRRRWKAKERRYLAWLGRPENENRLLAWAARILFTHALLLLCSASLSAQTLSTASYRLIRYADPAVELWWENQRFQDIDEQDVPCNLPPADAYTVPGFRIADANNAGRFCQWTAPAGAEIFLTMRSDRTNCFTLRQRPDEWTPWSDSAEVCVGTNVPGRPGNVRIVTP